MGRPLELDHLGPGDPEMKKKRVNGMPELRVRNSGYIKVQVIDDRPDGRLAIVEVGKNIPFAIMRAFVITNLVNSDAERGQHTHHTLRQVITCPSGSFDLSLDDGEVRQIIRMDNPRVGVVLEPMLWHGMTNFSPDCHILVVASDIYKEEDYIRSYEEFMKLAADRSRQDG